MKYVESFQATPRNLTVLVYDRFGLDLPALSEQVKEALTLLETQTYIQRNGNSYEYLTNEEQVIEEEIKNVDIDASEVSARLFKILSGDVIKTNKIRYAKNGQDFPFGFKLDDQAHGPQRELSVHFISPEYPYTPEEIRMHSAGKDELRVILDPDARVLSDLRLLIKTEKYIKRKQGTSISATVDQILRAKGAQNTEREKELTERVRPGRQGHPGHQRRRHHVDLAGRGDPGHRWLPGPDQPHLHPAQAAGRRRRTASSRSPRRPIPKRPLRRRHREKLCVPADEVLSFVIRKENLGEQVTVKTIVDSFQTKPYGWDLASIEVLIAFLVGTSKVTLTVDGNVLKRSEVAAALRNTQKHSHTVVARQKTFDERKVAAFRKFCTDFFDEANTPKDPLELARHGADKLKGKRDELKATVAGLQVPLRGAARRTDRPARPGRRQARRLVPDRIRPWRRPARRQGEPHRPDPGVPQRPAAVIYDEAAALLTTHSSNLGYLPAGSDETVRDALVDPNAFRGNRMAQLKQATDKLRSPDRRGGRGEPDGGRRGDRRP